ncbi:DUF6526 family protein [Terriglobus roseus]|uniref:Uncharacterized protein n=1 Tax=Terriglobus roseus TaxID=392734 RepID=A0A1G7FTE2_9BACT|nr:DUF6526 family protein [Terriglobus roseus]SDE79187.1 hypothetical protein SAMN05444167_0445 [Terriglobus roseus]
MSAPQNYQNHGRVDPKFHFFTIPLALFCFIASIFHVWKQPTPPNILLVPVTFVLFMTAGIARMYALQVQDRLIRLEESLRMERLGVSSAGLTIRQFVALRFASDAELPALTERARAEKLSGKQIKQAIVNWRADYERV